MRRREFLSTTPVESLEPRTFLAADFSTVAVNAVATQADSKIVVAGSVGPSGSGDFFLARFNVDGSLDATFGTSGIARTDFGGNDFINSVAIDSHGRIVAAGGGGVNADFAVARYTSAGVLDPSFNGSGERVIPFGGKEDALKVVIGTNDTILLAGETQLHAVGAPLARLKSDGTLDSTFGHAGTELLTISDRSEAGFISQTEVIRDVLIEPAGTILFAGDTEFSGNTDRDPYAVVGRLLANGSPDPALFQYISGDQSLGASVVEPSSGDIVANWFTYDYITITEGGVSVVTRNGTAVEDSLPGGSGDGSHLLTLPNGAFAGTFSVTFSNPDDHIVTTEFHINRYAAFAGGTNGPSTTLNLGDGTPYVNYTMTGSTVDAQGRIVLVGATDLGGFLLARYTADGQLDTTFHSTGIEAIGAATISGRAFDDKNADGLFGGDDSGISGFRVFLDQAPYNGVLDPGELTRPVSATGTYTFTNVPGGSYHVQMIPRAGWRQTSPAAGYYSIDIGGNQVAKSLSFANTDTGLIKGTVFLDANKNRQLDSGEPGLAGWYVYIDSNNDGVFDKGDVWALTDGNGNYRLAGLAAGHYVVSLASNARYGQTSPAGGSYSITLAAGATTSHKNFGEKRIASR